MKPFSAAIAAALIALISSAPVLAGEPASVLGLWNRLPDLPDTAPAAARWLDANRALVHPGVLALRADIEAHRRALLPIQQASVERDRAQAAVATDNLSQGLADVGIDMARMQSDPAYAQQVQERLRKMSPQEVMAVSQKMSQPMNRDKRYQNAAQAMVDDAPPVIAAAEAGQAYTQAALSRMATRQAIWREADEAVARVLKKPLAVAAPKPAMEWDNIGCDAACRARWDVYASQMLPLMVARDTEVLRIRRAALQRQRAAMAEGIVLADKHLVAARYGAASQSQVHRMHIAGYDASALGELDDLVAKLEDSVKSAAVVTRCGKQAVLAPLAVCH